MHLIPRELMVQLELLLRFRKDTASRAGDRSELIDLDPAALELLNFTPQVQSMIIELSSFRTQLKEGKFLKGQTKLDDGTYLPVSQLPRGLIIYQIFSTKCPPLTQLILAPSVTHTVLLLKLS